MTLKATALAAVIAAMATPAMAQYGWRSDYGPGGYDAPRSYDRPYDDARPYYGPHRDDAGISRYEIMAIVRSANLQPVSRPWRAGANFAVQAVNARGQTVRVLIDAHRGRILNIAAVDMAPPSARMTPEPRIDGNAPNYGDDEMVPEPPRPVPNAKAPGSTNRTAAATPVHPPMPRPRPAYAPSPAAAVKPAPEAPSAPAAAPPAAPQAETAPAPAPKAGPAGEAPFPPPAPLD